MKLLTNTSTTALVTAGALLSAVMMVAAPAWAAEPGAPAPMKSDKTPPSVTSTYQQERADCMAGRTAEGQKTCLREAAAAREEAKRGRLQSPSTQELANNAMLRCQRVPERDREDCRAMVLGQGTRDGSVANGAILMRIDRMVEENPTAAGAAGSSTMSPKAMPRTEVPQRPNAPASASTR